MLKLTFLPMTTLYLVVVTTLFLLLQTHFSICKGVSLSGGLNSLKTNEIDVMVKRACTKKIEDCFTEPEMDSETTRRVLLLQKKYISYETLKRDIVPCDKPGASYYECHTPAANHYDRGCEVITRCARRIGDSQT